MIRKWSALAITMASVASMAAGLAVAADEDSAMHKLMEKINKENGAITKAVRTAVAYKKAQSELADRAKELAKLGKEGLEDKESADKQKKSFDRWKELMQDYITKSEEFAAVVEKSETTQVQAKDAYKSVSKTCSNCHGEFRVDE